MTLVKYMVTKMPIPMKRTALTAKIPMAKNNKKMKISGNEKKNFAFGLGNQEKYSIRKLYKALSLCLF